METPAWAPGSVRAAYRGRTGDPGEMMSGRSWKQLQSGLNGYQAVLDDGGVFCAGLDERRTAVQRRFPR